MTSRPSPLFRFATILIALVLTGMAPAWHSRPTVAGGALAFESARRESQLVLGTPDRSTEALVLKQTSVRPGGPHFVLANGIQNLWRVSPHLRVPHTGRKAFRRNPPLVGTVELRI